MRVIRGGPRGGGMERGTRDQILLGGDPAVEPLTRSGGAGKVEALEYG